jgi:hypothetical protein
LLLSIILATVLFAMAGLFIVDRAAAAFTSDQIRDRVAADLAAHEVEYGSLAVGVAGTPFLAQAVTGTLEEIRIEMTDLRTTTAAAATVTIASVDVVATGVRVNVGDLLRGEPTAIAQQVAGNAVITYATLDSLVSLPGLSLADIHFSEADGALRFDALGALVPVQAVADISVEEGQLRIRLRDARFASNVLPPLGTELLNQILATSIDLFMPELPLGLALQSVTPGPDGLSISVVGQDVLLTAP